MKWIAVILLAVGTALAQECGNTPTPPIEEGRSGRIVNGIEARPNSFPWQVAQCRGTSSQRCSLICGGTVITDRFLLSAAHCVVGQSPNAIGFKFGAHSLSNTNDEGQGIARVARFISHPRYNSQRIINDIAVVELREPLPISNKVQPICVADTDDHLEQGTRMIDIGWGRLGGFGPIPDRLQQTLLVHHSRANCQRMFAALGNRLDNSVTCCGGERDLKSVCFGDSGGPYFKKDDVDGKYYQYGVNSFVFSRNCAQVGRPNGMSRVPFLCPFLNEHVPNICITPPESTRGMAATAAPMFFA